MKRFGWLIKLVVLVAAILAAESWVLAAPVKQTPQQEKLWSALNDRELDKLYFSTQELCTFTRQLADLAVAAYAASGEPSDGQLADALLDRAKLFCGQANMLYVYLDQLDREEKACRTTGINCTPRSLQRLQSQKAAREAAAELTGEKEAN